MGEVAEPRSLQKSSDLGVGSRRVLHLRPKIFVGFLTNVSFIFSPQPLWALWLAGLADVGTLRNATLEGARPHEKGKRNRDPRADRGLILEQTLSPTEPWERNKYKLVPINTLTS